RYFAPAACEAISAPCCRASICLPGVDRFAYPGRAAPADQGFPCRNGAVSACGFATMRQTKHGIDRRPTHKGDLPLRLSIAAEPNRRFRYAILRNDGTVAQASSAVFSTEAEAQSTGIRVLRRRSLAARLTILKQPSD